LKPKFYVIVINIAAINVSTMNKNPNYRSIIKLVHSKITRTHLFASYNVVTVALSD